MKESNDNEEISIKIQTLDNTYSFKIKQSYTILQLKEDIFKKFNIPIDRQRLIFQGKFLKEAENLTFYKITDGCVIQLIAKSLEENNNQNQSQANNRNHNNRRLNEVYPIIQIPFRTNRRRRRVVMPHFDISEYLEGFYQNLISLDNFNKCKNNINYDKNIIEAFDFSKSTYEVGEWVDVKDTINQWLEAQVIKVQNDKAYVHYNGWGTRWDEWIEFSSPRMRNFKTYTLQTPLAFSVSPYPAIPCDSNIEPQQRPIDIFYYIEKTKKHMEDLLDELNKLLSLRKNNTPLFKDDKFNKDKYEILFKATQMIPFLDRVGRMLSDISLVFSHFMVNPNYYSSFLFGYKRQDLFNEIAKMKKDKKNEIFDDDKIENNNSNINKDTQTPPLENKFLKKIQSENKSQSQQTQQTQQIKNSQKKSPEKDKDKNKNEIKVNNIDKTEDSNKIKDKKEVSSNNTINNNIQNLSQENKENKNKKEDKKTEKENKNISNEKDNNKIDNKNDLNNKNEIKNENIDNNEENHAVHHRHNSYSAPSISEEEENNDNTANFQRQRQRIAQEEILPNQIATNLGYDLSFSTVELPFIQRIIYSYTPSDRIISPLSPFYQIFSNKKLFPRVNIQIPTMLPPGEVIMMTGYSPFPETNFDIYIHTIVPNENGGNSNNNNNDNNNRNSQANTNNLNINNINNNSINNNNNQNNINNNNNQNDNNQNNINKDEKK